jgi:hypothetical protein
MMRLSKVWTALIISSVFFLIANAPAYLLKPYLTNSLNFPYSINGTIWQGSASSKHFQKLSWRVDPLYLLTGKLSSQISILVDSENQINANATINLGKKLELNNIKGVLTTQYLQQFFPETPFLFQASINIDQTHARWNSALPPNLPSLANGELLAEKVNLLDEKLGSYRFNYSYSNNSLEGSITSTDDSSVDTNLKLHISPQNVLTIQGEVLPKSKTLKTIFKELNIALNPNIKTQLPSF